jgi:hypothetical protein
MAMIEGIDGCNTRTMCEVKIVSHLRNGMLASRLLSWLCSVRFMMVMILSQQIRVFYVVAM